MKIQEVKEKKRKAREEELHKLLKDEMPKADYLKLRQKTMLEEKEQKEKFERE